MLGAGIDCPCDTIWSEHTRDNNYSVILLHAWEELILSNFTDRMITISFSFSLHMGSVAHSTWPIYFFRGFPARKRIRKKYEVAEDTNTLESLYQSNAHKLLYRNFITMIYIFVHLKTFWLSVCLFESYKRPCSAHAGHIGTDRSLLTGHNALLLRQIARDLLHALSHRHNNTWTAFVEPVVSTGGNKLIPCW